MFSVETLKELIDHAEILDHTFTIAGYSFDLKQRTVWTPEYFKQQEFKIDKFIGNIYEHKS
jgi:hypothetical protein